MKKIMSSIMFLISTWLAASREWIYIASPHSDPGNGSGTGSLSAKGLAANQRDVIISFINKLQIDHSIVRHSPIFPPLAHL